MKEPIARMQAAHRAVVPPSVQVLIRKLKDARRTDARYDHRQRAITIAAQWARESGSTKELRERLLQARKAGPLEAAHDAFAWGVAAARANELDTTRLAGAPLDIARQLLDRWDRSMNSWPHMEHPQGWASDLDSS